MPCRELAQFGVALQVKFGVGQIGLVLGLLGDGLIECCLVGAWIDLGQDIALLHQLAFLERDLVDLTVHPGADDHGIERLNGTQTKQVDRKIRLFDRRQGHGNRCLSSRATFLTVVGLSVGAGAVEPVPAEKSQRDNGQDQHTPADYSGSGHLVHKLKMAWGIFKKKATNDIICMHLMCKHTIT